MPTWIYIVQWVSRIILVLLAGLSVWSIAIMIDRVRMFKKLKTSDDFEEARALIETQNITSLNQWVNKTSGLRAGTLKAAMSSLGTPESIDRSVRSYLASERIELERGLATLATLGSNAPFIGLFGTVLGIIQAFGALSQTQAQSASSSVMSGISEALVATAIGLLVAVPAVIAYNVFTREMRKILVECESLRDLYISRRK